MDIARKTLSVVLVLVAIIHLLPWTGALGADRLSSLYGVSLSDPGVLMLMRHRAWLFAVLGGFFLASAFVPALQLSALLMATASVVSFLVLAWNSGPHNGSIARVVAVDVVALLLLAAGFVAYLLVHRRHG